MGGEILTAITGFLAWFRSYKRWLALLICCVVLLFVPSEWLRRLSLLDFATKYRPWIALGALSSAAMLLADIVEPSRKWIFDRYQDRRSHRVGMPQRIRRAGFDQIRAIHVLADEVGQYVVVVIDLIVQSFRNRSVAKIVIARHACVSG